MAPSASLLVTVNSPTTVTRNESLQHLQKYQQKSNGINILNENKTVELEYKWKIVWINVIILGLLHLGAVYGFYLKLTSPYHGYLSSGACKFFALAGSFGITAGAHRLWTHRSYQASYPAQILLMTMATFTYQNSVYIWARDHRLHHKFSETDADPHNARRGFFFSHIGWLLIRKHPDVKTKGRTIDMSDLERNPIVMFQHRHYFKLVVLIAVLMPIAIERLLIGAPWRETIFIYTIYRYVVSVNTTWCVNSLAHIYGYKPYNTKIGPTENPLMKIIGMGEGFHNYHHTYPWDYKASEFVNDYRNPTTLLIDLLASIGWVWDRKSVPKAIIDQRVVKTGDAATRDLHMVHETIKKRVWNLIYFGLVCSYIILA